MKLKYCYFFRPTLQTHVHLYHSWVLAARSKGIDIELLTILPRRVYLERAEMVSYWQRQNGLRILKTWRADYSAAVTAFFRRRCRFGRRVVVHLRKQPIEPFVKLRSETRNRLRFVVDMEDDVITEAEYLRDHPYKPDFYGPFQPPEKLIAFQEATLTAADQGRQVCHQVDTSVRSRLQGQSGAAATVCVSLQPGELPADSRVAEGHQPLVADDAQGKADSNRSQGNQTRRILDVPDG